MDAERSILGAILLDNNSYFQASQKLRADDLSIDSHRRIYARIIEMMEANRSVDIITLSEELRTQQQLEAVGGVAYLASLTDGVPPRAEHRALRQDRQRQGAAARTHQSVERIDLARAGAVRSRRKHSRRSRAGTDASLRRRDLHRLRRRESDRAGKVRHRSTRSSIEATASPASRRISPISTKSSTACSLPT